MANTKSLYRAEGAAASLGSLLLWPTCSLLFASRCRRGDLLAALNALLGLDASGSGGSNGGAESEEEEEEEAPIEEAVLHSKWGQAAVSEVGGRCGAGRGAGRGWGWACLTCARLPACAGIQAAPWTKTWIPHAAAPLPTLVSRSS